MAIRVDVPLDKDFLKFYEDYRNLKILPADKITELTIRSYEAGKKIKKKAVKLETTAFYRILLENGITASNISNCKKIEEAVNEFEEYLFKENEIKYDINLVI